MATNKKLPAKQLTKFQKYRQSGTYKARQKMAAAKKARPTVGAYVPNQRAQATAGIVKPQPRAQATTGAVAPSEDKSVYGANIQRVKNMIAKESDPAAKERLQKNIDYFQSQRAQPQKDKKYEGDKLGRAEESLARMKSQNATPEQIQKLQDYINGLKGGAQTTPEAIPGQPGIEGTTTTPETLTGQPGQPGEVPTLEDTLGMEELPTEDELYQQFQESTLGEAFDAQKTSIEKSAEQQAERARQEAAAMLDSESERQRRENQIAQARTGVGAGREGVQGVTSNASLVAGIEQAGAEYLDSLEAKGQLRVDDIIARKDELLGQLGMQQALQTEAWIDKRIQRKVQENNTKWQRYKDQRTMKSQDLRDQLAINSEQRAQEAWDSQAVQRQVASDLAQFEGSAQMMERYAELKSKYGNEASQGLINEIFGKMGKDVPDYIMNIKEPVKLEEEFAKFQMMGLFPPEVFSDVKMASKLLEGQNLAEDIGTLKAMADAFAPTPERDKWEIITDRDGNKMQWNPYTNETIDMAPAVAGYPGGKRQSFTSDEMGIRSGGGGLSGFAGTGIKTTSVNDDGSLTFTEKNAGNRKYATQCAGWVNDITGLKVGSGYDTIIDGPPKTDFADIGKAKDGAVPVVGGIFIHPNKGKFGHIGMIEKVFPDGSIRTAEYNTYGGDKFHRRTLSRAQQEAMGMEFGNSPVSEHMSQYAVQPGGSPGEGQISNEDWTRQAAFEMDRVTPTQRQEIMNEARERGTFDELMDQSMAQPLTLKEKYKEETSFRKELDGLMKNPRESIGKIKKMGTALDEIERKVEAGESISTDTQAIVFLFNKILDEGSAVKEGEYARVGDGAPMIAKLEDFKRKWSEGGEIPPSELRNVLQTARLFESGFKNSILDYTQRAQYAIGRMGLDEKSILTPEVLEMVEEMERTQQDVSSQPQQQERKPLTYKGIKQYLTQ